MAEVRSSQPLILSTRSSKLQSKKFVESNSMTFPVPAGKVIKSFVVQTKGNVTPTFASAPTVHPHGIMDALINAISFIDDKGNTIKKVTPEWMRFQCRHLVGNPMPEYYKVNATTLGTTPTKGVEGTPFAVGTTGQSIAFVSSIEVSFENKLSTDWSKTFYALKSNIASYIQIDTKSFKNIEKAGGANITACVGDVDIEIQLIEAPMEMNSLDFEIFRQSFIKQSISQQLNEFPIELPRQGRIQGLRLALSQGAGLDRISMDLASNTRFKLVGNGREIIRDVTLMNLISENLTKRFQDDVVNGTAYLSLLNNSDYRTALPANAYSRLDLVVSTDSTMTYSPSAQLEIGIDEILAPLK
jgi:hypothetical protein